MMVALSATRPGSKNQDLIRGAGESTSATEQPARTDLFSAAEQQGMEKNAARGSLNTVKRGSNI